MEVDDIHQTQGGKFPRIGGDCNNEIGQKGEDQYPDDEEDGELRMSGGGNGIGVGSARFYGWPTSRIVRVSRASGGKDRHSKVLTSKGLRDRRVRLSVTTAIQFYDLQDRLGYDQPSKAVEWLLKAAAKSIDELPCINTSFPDTPKQLSDEKRSIGEGVEHGFDSAEVELDGDNNYQHQQQQQQQQHVSLSKSACSSNSETSKGSSLSRSERHIKARERAKERRAGKEKERETESRITNPQNVNPISRSSFTELLTGGINNVNSNSSSNGETNLVQKSSGQWSSAAPMDYFSSGLLALSSSSPRNHHSSGFQLGNSLPPHSMFSTVSGDHHHHHQEMQHFSFNPNPDPDHHHHHHLIPVMNAAGSGGGSEYNLNFTISSPSSTSPSLAGFNRGTLQSNSPSLLPHLQRLSPTIDGSNSNLPFFIGTASPNAAPVENHNHHHYPDGGLQLCYGGDGGNRHSDHKGKGKN